MKRILLGLSLLLGQLAWADTSNDYLVQVTDGLRTRMVEMQAMMPMGTQLEDLGVAGWVRIAGKGDISRQIATLAQNPQVLHVQKNFPVRMLEDFRAKDASFLSKLWMAVKGLEDSPFPSPGEPIKDNPEIPSSGSGGNGADPEFSKQWGMNQIGARDAWRKSPGSPEVVVAVIDTGVDYTHEDLVDNMWRNPGETGRDGQGRDKATNGVDDDANGFVDDQVGWDFASNDNKPFDLTVSLWDLLMGGGNPGHGTHCAGNVAARGNNGKGIAGVAPNVRIMAIRFLTEKGQGTTADAIKSVRYAIDNGAKVMSNSWGSEGEDPNEGTENKALRDMVQYAQDKGVIFVAAAGNGHNGAGYDNDRDPKPGYPASYDHDIIISVAAIDVNGNLGSFSNWGARSVDLGAPGVAVFSTVPGNQYTDTVADMFGQKITWDGTSMATPHVAGAAALYWSANPGKTWREVKDAILGSAKKTSVLSGKTVSGGQLDVSSMMNR